MTTAETLAVIEQEWGVDFDRIASPISLPHVKRHPGLLRLFHELGFKRGAEIGIEQGEFSERICQQVPGVHLTCVDAWAPYRGYREHVTAEKLDGFYEAAVARLTPYGCELVRAFSVEAAKGVPDGSLDFVFVDANHTLPHVMADIAAWAPKVRTGGIVAGHDFGRAKVGHVREAVQAWTTAYQIAPWFILAGDRSPSWAWVA